MAILGYFCRILDCFEVGDLVRFDADLERFAELAEQLRQPLPRAHACIWQGGRAAMRGDFGAAEQLAEQAMALGEGMPRAATGTFVLLCGVREWQGRLAEVEEQLARLAELIPQNPAYRSGLAYLYAEIGKRAEASAVFTHLMNEGLQRFPRDIIWI